MTDTSNDFALTIQELSNTYEELSLLYRMTGVFSLLGVDDICMKIVQEAKESIGVKTAAVLFLDEEGKKLYTKASLGNWTYIREFPKDNAIIWKAIEARRASAFCKLADTEYKHYLPDLKSIMVCPILGKAKVLGALIVADKEWDEEFYSSDSKLLMAITSQAGLAIENAFLHHELESLLIGAIRCLVKALEASSYWTAGHTERVTEYSISIGKVMGLDHETIERLKISSLLHDIGKIATPKDILNKNGKLDENEWEEIRRHPLLGADILVELKQFNDIISTIKCHHEHWDGRKGLMGLKQEEIPLMARILSVADTFDAMTSDRPYRPMRTKEEAIQEIVRCSGTQFDPKVVEAFLKWVVDFIPRHPAPEF